MVLKMGRGKVLSNQALLPQYYRLEFQAGAAVQEAKSGQFLMIKAGDGSDPLLGRPMGLNIIDKEREVFGIVYQVIGKGTQAMAKLRPGDTFSFTGPWGNGWQPSPSLKKAALIGGGAGIAPLLPLAEELFAQGCALDIYLGASHINRLFDQEKLAKLGRVMVATIDGSLGQQGMVDEFLPHDQPYEMVFSCGPKSMLEKVAAWSEGLKIPCRISMEERMGCGIGTCMGCVCTCKDEDGSHAYRRICREGPVFDSREVVFHG